MSEPDLPGQGIVRVAYTPHGQPDATVIAPGHVAVSYTHLTLPTNSLV